MRRGKKGKEDMDVCVPCYSKGKSKYKGAVYQKEGKDAPPPEPEPAKKGKRGAPTAGGKAKAAKK